MAAIIVSIRPATREERVRESTREHTREREYLWNNNKDKSPVSSSFGRMSLNIYHAVASGRVSKNSKQIHNFRWLATASLIVSPNRMSQMHEYFNRGNSYFIVVMDCRVEQLHYKFQRKST